MLRIFIDASVGKETQAGAYVITEKLDHTQVTVHTVELTSKSSTLAELELALKLLSTIGDREAIIYTDCQTLENLHTVRRYKPNLSKHRNYDSLYKPLLDLLVGKTIVKVKGHAPGRHHGSTTASEIELIFSLVDRAARNQIRGVPVK